MTLSPHGREFVSVSLCPAPPTPSSGGRARGAALLITLLIHVAVLVGLMAGFGGARRVAPAVSALQISLVERPQKMAPPPPPLAVRAPNPVSVSVPDMAIENPPPRPVQTPILSDPTPPSAPAPAAGEGRDAFLARVLAQLNRHKRYPPEARRAHIEGVVNVHFVMDAEGRVLSAEISKSCGRAVLDAEALALLRRAQPLPALPPDFPGGQLDAILPIAFSLRN